MSRTRVAVGAGAGLAVGVVVGLALAPSGRPQQSSYPDGFAVMAAVRAGGVPCEVQARYTKYPAYSCVTSGGAVLDVVSRGQGGLPRGPVLVGPDWSVTSSTPGALVPVQRALGGTLHT